MEDILAIDDEPALLQLFRAALSQKGHRVYTAGDVEDALRLLDMHEVGLLLLDVHLAGGSGLEAFRALRERTRVPVLFVTGDPAAFSQESGAEWEREISTGAAEVLYKPFDIQVLYEKVAALLRRHADG